MLQYDKIIGAMFHKKEFILVFFFELNVKFIIEHWIIL